MNIYQDLEDRVYDFVNALFPAWQVKFMYDNSTELETPYLVIDVRMFDPVGRSYTSSSQSIDDLGKSHTTTIQDYQATVRFEFVGLYDNSQELAQMAHELEFQLRTQRGYELQSQANLALMKYSPVRRMPLPRETNTYMYYQLDVVFGYALSETIEQDYMLDIGIHGVYHDAGREPTHTIETYIEINPNRRTTT
jgi:hypothetical protein